MADIITAPVDPVPASPARSIDEARAFARERFKTRLLAGEQVGGCDCHGDDALPDAPAVGVDVPTERVAGVRFRDSGRTYYFRPADFAIEVGDWVVVETSRGREAGRVVIAPHQVRLNRLEGDLRPILRRLGEDDVLRMEALKREAATAVKTFGVRVRARALAIKPITAEYSFDGSSLTLHYSVHDRQRAPDSATMRELTRELAGTFDCRVELRQVGPRDEARLLGGLGRCGRTLCCSSWLPVYPEISMNMAKTQDLPLNPAKVSGVCGRLLCCLSYENEQYKQMKAIMPRLGQTIATPAGPGVVVSLQLLKELVTVRLAADNAEVVFGAADLGLGSRVAEPAPPRPLPASDRDAVTQPVDAGEDDVAAGADGQPDGGRRRRRRRGRRPNSPGGSPHGNGREA